MLARGVASRLAPLTCALLAGCGGAAGSAVDVTRPASQAITKATATAYAHAVNLRGGDISGFTSGGREGEAPKPGRLAKREIRCSGGANPAKRLAQIESIELLAGRAARAMIMRSVVEVWPTPAFVAVNNGPPARMARSTACFASFLRALHRRMNEERKGRMRIGPFTIVSAPHPLADVRSGSLTRIDETRLRRSGAVRLHIFRDLFDFTVGAAEVELEAIGFSHPIPAATEARALGLLRGRAVAHAV